MSEITTADVFLEIAVGTLILVFMIFVHGAGIRAVNRNFSRSWAKIDATVPSWRVDLLLGVAIGSLTALHLAETLLWALPLHLGGLVPGLRDSYYFVLQNYTTLGDSNIDLPEKWRLLEPMVAMSGLFTFGWTAAVLVSIMTEFGKLDTIRARQSKVTNSTTPQDE